MATSSLLLLRRCLWYRHTRWPTSSSMILLRYSGRRFVTTIVVRSQGYVEYGAPADEIKIYYSVYVHRIITIRLQWRCHHRLWTIYMYVCLGGTFFGQCGAWSSIHPKIHMICMHTKYQVLSTTHTNNILHINDPVTDSMTPNIRDNNIWYMCSISRLGYVSGTVCIDENGVYSLVWYTHNNQLYWYEDGGTRSNNILMDVTLEV